MAYKIRVISALLLELQIGLVLRKSLLLLIQRMFTILKLCNQQWVVLFVLMFGIKTLQHFCKKPVWKYMAHYYKAKAFIHIKRSARESLLSATSHKAYETICFRL